MRVVQQLHYLHFSVDLFQVGRIQPGFIDDLDCHLKYGGGESWLKIANFKRKARKKAASTD